jgi:AcrR family transcriptional regulator
MTETSTTTRGRGRPRSATSQKAILATAIQILLEQGLTSMSMDDVAKRAGVSKATIYRWWASKELLALDALATEWALPTPGSDLDTGSLRGDLLARLRPWLGQLNEKPYERIIAGLLAQTQTDPGFAKLYRERFVAPRRDETRVLLVRAIDRGEIGADTNLEVTLDLLYGPIYHRLLHRHAPLNDQFATQVIDAVIGAISCGGLATGRPSRSPVATKRPAPRGSAAAGR